MFVGGQTNDQPLGALNFGSRLLGNDRQVGEAFVRAYIRGQEKYLSGDYHKDPKAMQGLADELGVPLASLTSTPSLRWDYQIKPGTTDEMQKVYRAVDSTTLSYPKSLDESKLVDRSFYEDAVKCLKAEGTLK
jgi:NitT/TauT family transport system substrate-binding protein